LLAGLDAKVGIANLLALKGQQSSLAGGVHHVMGLDMIPAGLIAAGISELFSSPDTARLISEAKAAYDFIIVDTPPLLLEADSVVLTGQLDAVILVCRSCVSKSVSVERTVELLDANDVSILGCVFNAIDTSSVDYRVYYGDSPKALKSSKSLGAA
jgi:receptor protein-tyrosine kinase